LNVTEIGRLSRPPMKKPKRKKVRVSREECEGQAGSSHSDSIWWSKSFFYFQSYGTIVTKTNQRGGFTIPNG
jgi:hypothetical protein